MSRIALLVDLLNQRRAQLDLQRAEAGATNGAEHFAWADAVRELDRMRARLHEVAREGAPRRLVPVETWEPYAAWRGEGPHYRYVETFEPDTRGDLQFLIKRVTRALEVALGSKRQPLVDRESDLDERTRDQPQAVRLPRYRGRRRPAPVVIVNRPPRHERLDADATTLLSLVTAQPGLSQDALRRTSALSIVRVKRALAKLEARELVEPRADANDSERRQKFYPRV